MKKLLFIAFAAFALASMLSACKSGINAKLAQAKPVDSTLNGIDSTTFFKQHLAFLQYKFRGNDKDLVKTNFWFPRVVFDDIYNLLIAEKKTEQASIQDTIGITDGVRVYIIYDPKQAGADTEYKIAFVSTKNAGSQTINGKRYTWHQNYFQHDFNNNLFKLSNLTRQGVISHDSTKGAVLYNTRSSSADDPNCDFKILHTRRRKEAEQMVQGFYNHALNTSGAWFDLNLFQLLHDDIKHDGVRLYFATYPNTPTEGDYKNRDTFVFTTTSKDASGKYEDDFTCDKPTSPPHNASSYSRSLPPLNTGELCPDNCD